MVSPRRRTFPLLLVLSTLAGGCGPGAGGGGGGGGGSPTLPVRVQVRSSGLAAGKVRVEPGGHVCEDRCTFELPSGTEVTATAEPPAGLVHAGWTGACSGTGTCSVTLEDEDVVLEAGFAPAGAWSVAAMGSMNSQLGNVAQHTDGSITVVGNAGAGTQLGTHTLEGGTLLARLAPGGAVRWVLTLPRGVEHFGLALAPVPETGDVVALARFLGTVDFGQGAMTSGAESDVVAFRVDASGQVLWARALPRADWQSAGAILATVAGEVYAAFDTFREGGSDAASGHMAILDAADGTVRVDPASINGVVGVKSLTLAADGKLLLTGNGGTFNGVYLEAWERNLDFAWRLPLQEDVSYSEGTSLVVGEDGTIYLAGTFDYDFAEVSSERALGKDLFLLAVRAPGEVMWKRHLRLAGVQRLAGMGRNADGALVLGGLHDASAFDPLDFGGGDLRRHESYSELFIVRFSSTDGSYLSGLGFGSEGRDDEGALSVGPAGVVLTGTFSDSVHLGDQRHDSGDDGTSGLLLRLER